MFIKEVWRGEGGEWEKGCGGFLFIVYFFVWFLVKVACKEVNIIRLGEVGIGLFIEC